MFWRRLSFSTLAYTRCVCSALGGSAARMVRVDTRLARLMKLDSCDIVAVSCCIVGRCMGDNESGGTGERRIGND